MHTRCPCLHLRPRQQRHPAAAEPFKHSTMGMQLARLEMLRQLISNCPGNICWLAFDRASPVVMFMLGQSVPTSTNCR